MCVFKFNSRIQVLENKMNMPDSFHMRLKLAMPEGSNPSSFAKEAGVSQSGFHRVFKGGEPGLQMLVAIAKAANVNVGWLATGEGAMRPGEREAQKSPEYVGIPRYDASLSAGNGIWNADRATLLDHIPFTPEFLRRRLGRSSTEDLLVLTAEGESMDPVISDGDLVMIDQRKKDLKDGIFAFVHNGEARIKWLRKTITGDIEVISLNQSPLFPKEIIKKDELEGFQLIGKVVWCGHHFAR